MLTSYHQGNFHFSLNKEKVVKAEKPKLVVEEPQEKPKKKRRKKS